MKAYFEETSEIDFRSTQVFPKIDHSGINARIILEQNKFSKKIVSNRD